MANGYACFPYLGDYVSKKLQPCSLACIFVGFSEHYRGYRCLHLLTNRLYTSRHVVFHEDSFPCAAATSSSPPVQEIVFVPVGPLPINFISDRPSSPLPSVGPSLQQQSLSHVYYVATSLDSLISRVSYHVVQPYFAYFCSTKPCHALHKLACCSTTFSTIHRLASLFFNASTTSSYRSLQPNSYLL